MKKQIPTAIGILIVLLTAGVAGASVLFLSQKEEIEVKKYNDTEEKGIEFAELVAACEKIEYYEWRDDCYMDLALFEKDLSICEKIENLTEKDACHRFIVGSTTGTQKKDGAAFLRMIFC